MAGPSGAMSAHLVRARVLVPSPVQLATSAVPIMWTLAVRPMSRLKVVLRLPPRLPPRLVPRPVLEVLPDRLLEASAPPLLLDPPPLAPVLPDALLAPPLVPLVAEMDDEELLPVD